MNVSPKACFKSLKGVASSQLYTITAIQPIVALNRSDKRFIEHYDVGTEIDNSTNLASMHWEDFEHLIRELFEKEFSCNGGEVKVTQASRDAQRHRRLQDQWHIYCNSLVQGITLSKARLHHAMSCAPDKELCFVLFEHFRIYVTLADGFNSHTIEYYVETKDGEDKQRIAQAQLSIDGMIDGKVNIRDREQVLEHYLEKIAGVYDSLYTAIENNVPVNLSQLVKGQSPAA